MRRILNIPISTIRRYSRTKRDKEALCFAVWCKMQHSNSIMFSMTKIQVKKSLCVSHQKATRILDAIHEDSFLFTPLDDGRFLVNSFKDKEIKTNKKGEEYTGATVFRIEVRQDYTLKELYNIINNALYEYTVWASEQNRFHVSTKCLRSYITGKEFEKVVGMGHGSIARIKKTLVKSGRISSTLAEKHYADERNLGECESALKKQGVKTFTYSRKGVHCVVVPCSYTITNRRVNSQFVHKIYGYSKKKAIHQYTTMGGTPDYFYC